MAPRDQTKTPPKVLRSILKTNTTTKGYQASANSVIKKTMSTVKKTDKTQIKATSNGTNKEQQRPNVGNVPTTPKAVSKPVAVAPGSVTRSAVKAKRRGPKPAHSGVPVPEKMRKLLEKRLANHIISTI